jgi:YD repeat-containing protein
MRYLSFSIVIILQSNLDDNGNTIKDSDGKIGFIQYDITNHPIRTFLTTGQVIDYFYDASGNMVRKYEGINDVHVLGADGQTEAVCRMGGKTRLNNIIAGADIIGRYTAATDVNLTLSNMTLNDKYEAPNSITVEDNVYVEGVAKLKACNSIKLLPGFTCSEGNTFTASIGEVASTADRFYYLKDHLGSIKMMVDQNGEVKSYDDYYPFGMTMAGRSSVTIEIKWR